jgi:hypothetical protein
LNVEHDNGFFADLCFFGIFGFEYELATRIFGIRSKKGHVFERVTEGSGIKSDLIPLIVGHGLFHVTNNLMESENLPSSFVESDEPVELVHHFFEFFDRNSCVVSEGDFRLVVETEIHPPHTWFDTVDGGDHDPALRLLGRESHGVDADVLELAHFDFVERIGDRGGGADKGEAEGTKAREKEFRDVQHGALLRLEKVWVGLWRVSPGPF